MKTSTHRTAPRLALLSSVLLTVLSFGSIHEAEAVSCTYREWPGCVIVRSIWCKWKKGTGGGPGRCLKKRKYRWDLPWEAGTQSFNESNEPPSEPTSPLEDYAGTFCRESSAANPKREPNDTEMDLALQLFQSQEPGRACDVLGAEIRPALPEGN